MAVKSVVSDALLGAFGPASDHDFFDRSRCLREIPMPAFPRLHGRVRNMALLIQPFFYRQSAELKSVKYVVIRRIIRSYKKQEMHDRIFLR